MPPESAVPVQWVMWRGRRALGSLRSGATRPPGFAFGPSLLAESSPREGVAVSKAAGRME